MTPADDTKQPAALPDGCSELDFVGASQDALNAWAAASYVTPERFLRFARDYLHSNLVTHDQLPLVVDVLRQCLDEHLAALKDDGLPVPEARQ